MRSSRKWDGRSIVNSAVKNIIFWVVMVVTALLIAWRRWLLAGRRVEEGLTWDCGYAQPSARMQYTAASFAEPVLAPFDVTFQKSSRGRALAGLFPTGALHDEHLEERVVALVEAAGMQDDCIFMSLNQEQVRRMKDLRPNWRCGLLAAKAGKDKDALPWSEIYPYDSSIFTPLLGEPAAAGSKSNCERSCRT